MKKISTVSPCMTLLLLVWIGMGTSQSSFANSENTGAVLKVCGSETELLEAYEARRLDRAEAEFTPAPADFLEAIRLPLSRLAVLDPDRAKQYQIAAENLLGTVLDTRTLPEAPSISNLNSILLPTGCDLKRLTLRRTAFNSNEKVVYLDLQLWSMLTPQTQAEAVLHLLAEADLARVHVDAPASVRLLTETLSSNQLVGKSFKQYIEFWNTITPSANDAFETQGLRLTSSSLKFTDQGQLKSGSAAGDSEWKSKDSFGSERKGTIQDASTVLFSDSRIEQAEFKNLELTLMTPTGPTELKLSGTSQFYATGGLRSSTLAADKKWAIGKCEVFLPTKSVIQLSPSGILERLESPETSESTWKFCSEDRTPTLFRKNTFEKNQLFEFYENGQVKEGTLNADQAYRVFDGNFTFTRLTPMSFYPDGKVKRGQLKETDTVTLTTSTGKKRKYMWLPTLTFDHDGKVLGEY